MPRLKHMVVVVPGIGGSVVRTAGHAERRDERRWRSAAAALRGKWLSLDEHPDLVPVALMSDIRLMDAVVVPGYDGLVRRIRSRFLDVRVDVSRPGHEPDRRADLVLFPYDFRQSIRHAAERLAADVADRLGGEHATARRRRVIVVAHSMGGLVARYWLGPLGGADDCAALITLGTPHRGAPKALDVLANGLKVGPVRLAGITELLRQWPSVYELLPRYPAVGRPDGAAPLRPYEVAHPSVSSPTFAVRSRAAFGVHQDIEAAWYAIAGQPDQPEVTAVFSRGHATLQHSWLSSDGVTVTKEAPGWLPNPDWHGDGTVPVISAIPIELTDNRARRAVPERHLPLVSSSVVTDLLAEYTSESLSAVRGDRPDRPWLGLDLDDTALSGHPVPVGVTLHGAQADERTRIRLRARALDAPETAASTPWLTAAPVGDGRWRTDLPPLTAGSYRVDVAATGMPGATRLQADDVLGVVGEESMEANTQA